jgi:DNA-binding transcriptional LysR family regulator
MELPHLRVAVVLAEVLHFGRTAKRLRIAQSAVSQMIKALEVEVGATLFARTKRSVALTPAGRQLVEDARRLLDDVVQVAVHVRRAASGETGQLHLRLIAMAALTDVPRMIARFQRRYPAVEVRVDPASSIEQIEAIKAGRCDVGFMSLASTKDDLGSLDFRVVTQSTTVTVLPAGHRLAGRRTLRLEDLASEPFVFLAQANEPHINAQFRRRCLSVGFEPNIVMEVQQTDALLAFVAAGLGVSCAPSLIQRLSYRGIVTVPLAPRIRAGMVAVWHPERLSATGHRFLELLSEGENRAARRSGTGPRALERGRHRGTPAA